MKPTKNKSIAIVGGGPGGLTLASLLQTRGADVKVYERDLNKDARMQGGTLDLHEESGLRALREANLMQAFEENYRPGADKLRIMDKLGKIVYDEYATDNDESKAWQGSSYGRPEIDRGPLRKILLDSLAPGTVHWNHRFVSLSDQGTGWLLHFENAPVAAADLVIAADGANSKIRPYLTPVKPFYSGVTAIEGVVYDAAVAAPKIHELLKGGKIFAMGDEKSLIISSKGDGGLAFYFGLKRAEKWDKDSGIDFSDRGQLLKWFRSEFNGWSAVWEELMENAKLPIWPRPQYCMPLDQTWEALPDLTMVGDAAHLMPPYAGEGVNMAMLDAVELADCLTDEQFPDSRSAISHYEKQMRQRAAGTAADTMRNTQGLHGPDGIGFMLRMFNGH